jgi:dolichol-phosphate mannosyltransferase
MELECGWISTMRVSVVIPVFNEEDNIVPLVEEFSALAQSWPTLAEVVIVDDGSRDGTAARLRECAAHHAFLRPCRTKENRGQTAALLAGLAVTTGDVLVTMDGDLQNNPADIPALVARLGEDTDVVCGYRARRRDRWSRRAASRIGNAVRGWFTRDGVRDTGCSLKAFRRACLAALPPLNGAHRFMPAYFILAGCRVVELPVDHRPRRRGVSKYTNLQRLPRTLFDLIGFVWYRRRILRAGKLELLREERDDGGRTPARSAAEREGARR